MNLSEKIAVLAFVFLAGILTGWQVHSWKVDSAAAHALNKSIDTNTEIGKKTDSIVDSAAKQEQKTRGVYRAIHERIHDAPPNDRVCFTPESLQLWNSAITASLPVRQEPAGTPGKDGAVEGEEATASDILENAATNFEICNTNAIHHNALIDAVNAIEGKLCICH